LYLLILSSITWNPHKFDFTFCINRIGIFLIYCDEPYPNENLFLLCGMHLNFMNSCKDILSKDFLLLQSIYIHLQFPMYGGTNMGVFINFCLPYFVIFNEYNLTILPIYDVHAFYNYARFKIRLTVIDSFMDLSRHFDPWCQLGNF